jgi:sphinganine-1-phosphate aldolase
MTAGLLNGGDGNVVGAMTSGGTESIIMAVRAHLKIYGRDRGIEYPEIISGDTAHAGLNKACEMFGIRLVQIPCGEDTGYQLDPIQVKRCMNSNVIMIYSSAPCYPQGVIDPIDELSTVALNYNIGLHVDACLGGFILPFAKKMNYDIPNFDFSCPGVTSMSADTHKYGYASKGTSVVLYRNKVRFIDLVFVNSNLLLPTCILIHEPIHLKTLRRAQFFNYAKWSGGLYSTPTIAGSRAGALIACAWASLVAIGENGFKNRVKLIMDTTRDIACGVSSICCLKLLGCKSHPQAMIICFTSAKGYDLNIYQVAEYMNMRGWNLNSLQNPSSVHICVTLNTVGHGERFVTDLKSTVDELLANPPGKREGSSAAIYGVTGTMPAGPVNELLKVYTDVTLSC